MLPAGASPDAAGFVGAVLLMDAGRSDGGAPMASDALANGLAPPSSPVTTPPPPVNAPLPAPPPVGAPMPTLPGAPSPTPAPSPAPKALPAPIVPGPLGKMTIPTTHPRLWWTPARLAQAKTWFAAKPFTPRADDWENLALHYVLSGNTTSARKAITWLMAFTLSTDALSNDPARWFGETAMLVFDWCHDQMTPAERSTIVTRWNGYITTLNAKPWGGVGMEGNNYYTGYFRNTLEWAIASYHENAMAPALLEHALVTRWQNSFVPYATGPGRGGVPHEGTQYGRYALSYPVVPLTTATQLGADMWGQTGFFKEALYYLVYATPQARTVRGSGTGRFELFPFNDDELFKTGGLAEGPHHMAFAAAMIDRFRAQPIAGHAQAWMELVGSPLPNHVAAVHQPVPARAMAELPLDYYAPGNGFFYGRNKWGGDATMVHFQLGRATAVGHEHLDWGTFQMWRGGRWLTRESTGYAEKIAGWRGGAAVDTSQPVAHNAVLFDGIGLKGLTARKAPPTPIRMESRPQYAYAAVDLGGAYRSSDGRADRDNPYASKVVREMLFVRSLEALVVLDRLESSSEKKPAEAVVKTVLVHFETPPQMVGDAGVLATNGDQALRLHTLLPAKPSYRVVVEGGPGQHRLEIDASGAAQSHVLNVLHGRGAADADLTTSVRDLGSQLEVTLSHPSRGSARVVFEKGMASVGGSFAGASGAPTALIGGVQRVQVTDSGPVWE